MARPRGIGRTWSDYVNNFTNNQYFTHSRYPHRMVLIFGKNSCPYTQAARDHYVAENRPFEYVDVKTNPADLARMLTYSNGARNVPVIVDGDKVTIGFGGT